MRLLDLFCGAGGAARGYADAGFEVVGVDIEPQPNYPFQFIQADAFTVLDMVKDGRGWDRNVDAIHASPPCHDHSTVSGRNRKAKGPHGTGWMLDATLERLLDQPLPWVVENVGNVQMRGWWVTLCGSMFGLDVRRHRRFASSFLILDAPECNHAAQTPRFRSLDSRQKVLASVVGVHGHLNYAGEGELRNRAMGIDWMTQEELAQAIPPAYTEWMGRRLLPAVGGDDTVSKENET